jgi:pilus assembly protein CpaE
MTAAQMLKSPLQTPGPIERPAVPPASRADLMAFVSDGQSEYALQSCLAQLSVSGAIIRRGGLSAAIRHLSTERSPERLIVDISDAEMPASQMRDLAELCEPGVTVIAIGNKNDIGLYRDLVHAGVSEYIVKPVASHLLARAFLGSTISSAAGSVSRKLAKFVAVVGVRGGVGTTTLAAHLALYLATERRRRVVLLDLDLHTGSCALALDVKPTPGLREALANPKRIDSLFLDRTMALHGERLFVLSAEEPLRPTVEFTVEALETIIAALRSQFHYIIVDVPKISAAPYWQALEMADLRIIVADQTLRSVRDTVRLHEELQGVAALQPNMLVVNRSGEGGRRAMTLEEMAKVKLQPNFVLPFRPKLFAAPRPVERGAVSAIIAGLADEIAGRPSTQKQRWRFAR